ncbi:MAG TPA: hypothetical protein VMD91_03665 [Candidatus Sulfotelmatobacter sp.]|nr:hypothetical protein [Candidatus Sulfotelmatobacter sp.]
MAQTDSTTTIAGETLVGSVDLTVPNPIGTQAQYVQDQLGNQSALAVGAKAVGIGTSSPTTALTVQGGGSPPLTVRGSSLNYAMLGLWGDGAPDQWQLQATNQNPPVFRIAYPQNNPWFVIQAGGYVGIGTQTPQAKLDVNGTVRATGLQINGPLALQANQVTLTGLTTPPPGVTTVDVVVDPATGKLYRQN